RPRETEHALVGGEGVPLRCPSDALTEHTGTQVDERRRGSSVRCRGSAMKTSSTSRRAKRLLSLCSNWSPSPGHNGPKAPTCKIQVAVVAGGALHDVDRPAQTHGRRLRQPRLSRERLAREEPRIGRQWLRPVQSTASAARRAWSGEGARPRLPPRT